MNCSKLVIAEESRLTIYLLASHPQMSGHSSLHHGTPIVLPSASGIQEAKYTISLVFSSPGPGVIDYIRMQQTRCSFQSNRWFLHMASQMLTGSSKKSTKATAFPVFSCAQLTGVPWHSTSEYGHSIYLSWLITIDISTLPKLVQARSRPHKRKYIHVPRRLLHGGVPSHPSP